MGDPHLSPLPQGEERKLCTQVLIVIRGQVIGSAKILGELAQLGSATRVRERDKNLRTGFVESEKTSVLGLCELRNVEAEMGTKWLGGLADAYLFNFGD